MFQQTSRYSALSAATYVGPDGREITYVLRRFLPRASTLPLLIEVTVSQGERLDLIAARTIGDPEQFWRICDATNVMNPFDLEEVGRTIRVPVPQFEEPR
jgi:hypothetical protein